MEAASIAFPKEHKETTSSLTIPEPVDEVTNKEAPKTTLPPPYSYPRTPPGSFPVLQPCIHKLSFPTFDGKKDLLPWHNRCEQFFIG
jgi:hypothetical protein